MAVIDVSNSDILMILQFIVHFSVKVVLRGDRNVGKTCLFYRLQGQKFVEEYIPTDEIQVSNI